MVPFLGALGVLRPRAWVMTRVHGSPGVGSQSCAGEEFDGWVLLVSLAPKRTGLARSLRKR